MPELVARILGLQRFDERPVDIQARVGYRETLIDERSTSEVTAT